jgi:hypothetical protein
MRPFYTLEITVQRTDVEQKATVYFPLSVGLDISQTPVTQRLPNETSGTSHFLPPGMRQKDCGLTLVPCAVGCCYLWMLVRLPS